MGLNVLSKLKLITRSLVLVNNFKRAFVEATQARDASWRKNIIASLLESSKIATLSLIYLGDCLVRQIILNNIEYH